MWTAIPIVSQRQTLAFLDILFLDAFAFLVLLREPRLLAILPREFLRVIDPRWR